MKSPARVPSAHVPVVLMAPSGASVLTPLGESSWVEATPMVGAGSPGSLLRRAGLQGERVQLAAHLGLERFVDNLVLLHPRLAAEGLGEHGRRIVVAVAGEIADRHL